MEGIMSLQKQFLKFNDTIALDYEKRSTLKDKRDKIINILRNCKELPSFDILNQGSYAMHTGVEPIIKNSTPQEYDIDVALLFNEEKENVDPLEYKKIIYKTIDGITDYGAEIKKPCVTLTYKKNGERGYHIDLVTYTYDDLDKEDKQLYLARGKSDSDENICWEKGDPRGLLEYIDTKISDVERREQCRRIVRYLKRWKALKFGNNHSEPPSIAITLIAFDNFIFHKDNDLHALINIVSTISNLFTFGGFNIDGSELYTIYYSLPSSLKIDSFKNLFDKMSISQMTAFKSKIDKLLKDLQAVEIDPDLISQCEKLNKIFGEDFIVPEKKETSKKTQNNYLPFSSTSG